MFRINDGVEITSAADVPSSGSGLGSSVVTRLVFFRHSMHIKV